MHNLNPLKIDEINRRSNLKTNNYCMKLGMLAFDAELTKCKYAALALPSTNLLRQREPGIIIIACTPQSLINVTNMKVLLLNEAYTLMYTRS